jgi:hypothetical protein
MSVQHNNSGAPAPLFCYYIHTLNSRMFSGITPSIFTHTAWFLCILGTELHANASEYPQRENFQSTSPKREHLDYYNRPFRRPTVSSFSARTPTNNTLSLIIRTVSYASETVTGNAVSITKTNNGQTLKYTYSFNVPVVCWNVWANLKKLLNIKFHENRSS